MANKNISIWGSTGSIGTQTLDVISRHADLFTISVLTAHHNVDLLYKQTEIFKPKAVVITGTIKNQEWQRRFDTLGVDVFTGKEGLLRTAKMGEEDLIVNALVGGIGLEVTLEAIKRGVSVALANKEVLVMAGEIMTREAEHQGVQLIPIDSEHSAIFQCLQGESPVSIKKIILTASGGAFYKKKLSQLKHVTVEQALQHPNWSMGRKVTVDSATMMNKGLELIEARWLFDQDPDAIEVVIHPQSLIHSMVEFIDGSVKAQLGKPDMRVPISYALGYPERLSGHFKCMDFTQSLSMEFIPPDFERFPALKLAYQTLKLGGTAPAVFNGADEAAVTLFLNKKIDFITITEIVEKTLQEHSVTSHPALDDIMEADRWAKAYVMKLYT
ncbi:MAG: 1-deoxy-D-xylulose-5-phosphate reductoisomerase [bacterium]